MTLQDVNTQDKKMIVLVTGATGLIGKAIQDILSHAEILKDLQSFAPKLGEEEWIFVSSKDADLTDWNATLNLFEKYKPTHVIHLAARVGGLFMNMSNNSEMFNLNLKMNQNILEACHLYNVQKCISCLSTCIFPDKTSYPIDESMIHLGPPHSSNFGYSYAKRMVDISNKAYYDQYGHIFTSVIPTNVFGPNDNFHLQDGHVIPALIHQCYLAKRHNTPFVVKGSGQPLRQFIYSKDLAKLFIWALRQYGSVEPIIFSVDPESEISIAQVANLIVKHCQFNGQIQFDRSFSDGQFKKTASNKKLRNILPNFQFTPMEDAIQQTCAWFFTHLDSLRK